MIPPPSPPHEVYAQFASHLSALLSSLPHLVYHAISDLYQFLYSKLQLLLAFCFPASFRTWTVHSAGDVLSNALEEGHELLHYLNGTIFDSTSILAADAEERMRMLIEAVMENYSGARWNDMPENWTDWLRTKLGHVITADRTLASYLWQTCRGLILVLTVTSVMPGRLHGWTGRALRFPVLGMVYLLIFVELILYTGVRLCIRMLEWIFANPKHRRLRVRMARAESYKEWYSIATALDKSQGRDKWTTVINDDTAYRYSWPFILELLSDLKASREKGDVVMALAVLQQCTRKNVGGIMSEDMFR
jgi:hypothetical protein